MIVLRGDYYKGVTSLDRRAPVASMGVDILPKPRMVRLVGHRKSNLRKIQGFYLEATVRLSQVVEPFPHGRSTPPLAHARDNDLQGDQE